MHCNHLAMFKVVKITIGVLRTILRKILKISIELF